MHPGLALCVYSHTGTVFYDVFLSVCFSECLHDVFKWLGFEIEVHPDCSSEKMLFLLRKLSSRDHSQMDSVVCCILSHGQEGSVYGVDGLPVDFRELSKPLNGLKCSSLADKPKLFFIQACQGTRNQQAVYIDSDDHTNTICSDAVALTESIPSDADFLFAMSTVPSFVSFRERSKGSWFIQSLCRNLVQMVPRLVKQNIISCSISIRLFFSGEVCCTN